MPPKKCGSKAPAGKQLNDVTKSELLDEIRAPKFTGSKCMRCDEFDHGHINECNANANSKHWSKGLGNFADKQAVEKLFQAERAKVIADGTYTPVKQVSKPVAQDQPKSDNKIRNKPQNVVSTIPEDPASSSALDEKPATPVKKRTPIETENVGKVIYTKDETKAENVQGDIPKDGLANVATQHKGSEPSKGEFKVITNYVQVRKVPSQLLTYALTFYRPSRDPQRPNARVELNKRQEIGRVFDAMIEKDVLELDRNRKTWATDYKSLWCDTALQGPHGDQEEWDTAKFDCKLLDGRIYDDVYATVRKGVVLSDIDDVLRKEHITKSADYIRALNAHVAECVRKYNEEKDQSITQLGANKFYLDRGFTEMVDKNSNSLGLRAVRGYYMSIRPGALGPLLNINAATTAFLPPILVSDLLATSLTQNAIEKMLRGKRVRLIYQRQEFQETKDAGFSMNDELPRTKVFQQFGLPASKQRFFTVLANDKGAKVDVSPTDHGTTVIQYFNNMKAEMPSSPSPSHLLCVNVGKRVQSSRSKDAGKPAFMRQQTLDGAQWIPACLLEILPFQPMTGQMSPKHTAEMMRHALHLPAENAALIDQEGLRILGLKDQIEDQEDTTSKKYLDQGFQLDNKLISLAARSLELPRLLYEKRGDPKVEHTVSTQPHTKFQPLIKVDRSAWNLQDAAFIKPGTLNKLHVVGLPKCRQELKLAIVKKDFTEQLCTHHVHTTPGDHAEQLGEFKGIEEDLKSWFTMCQRNDCNLLLLAEKDFDKYAKIKRTSDFEGYHTICAIGSKIQDDRNNDHNKTGNRWQHLSNLALKVNLKLGGDNHWLDNEMLDKLLGGEESRRSTMILGSDVTHPGNGSKTGTPSIAAVVGTVDAQFMSYRGSMRLQAGGQEQIDEANLRSMVKERLETWKSCNDDKLPTRILFYRDGVSESQFANVEKSEIPQIREAYVEAGGNAKDLSVCFFVVSKRHHTRFYAATKNETYQSREKTQGVFRHFQNGNIKAGLLVDSVVTAPYPLNFFLQSHTAIKGTARSAHYYVLQNDTDIGAANLQELTMMLCYTFGRSTTGVSYATPAYAADRLCDRGRSYIRHWAEDEFAHPIFEYDTYYDGDGKERKPTNVEILSEKRVMVDKLLHSPEVWGKNYHDDPTDNSKPLRLNPWHPNLDQGMFWM
ncbi:hypothetical protein J4E93_002940 [Alternaria ventricosa]|uniref:uncharacterized protein n=1 Tax=Alternaria ventricosa TaxID=1187951 RepID=UPI0020C35A49|nr:uncharacterized protein J4E93_002940 [Alternaria ventricosa]KAI4650583.1 hypothetical protein J4E93_002940 [Alternaria ventricosa]